MKIPGSDLVPIAQYAERLGITANAIRRRCLRGTLPGAVKIGRDWLIPENAPYPDYRVKTGKYRNWRKKLPAE